MRIEQTFAFNVFGLNLKEKAMVLTSQRENLNDNKKKTFVPMNAKNSIP